MKIVYVYPQFAHLAGTERVLIDKMNYLSSQDNMDIYVLTHEQGSHPFAYPLMPAVKHVDLDVRFYSLYQLSPIKRFLKWQRYRTLLKDRFFQFMATIKPDIVIATTYHTYILSLILTCPTPFRKILESHIDKCYIHSNDPLNRWTLLRRLRSFCDMAYLNHQVCKFDILVAPNHKDAEDWSQFLKTRVIINMVHLNDKGKYSKLDFKHVIFVGRYTGQKGISELFRIWEIVYRWHPDWHLDLYGDGKVDEIPYRKEERMNIKIHVHKPDSDIFSRYLESSVFVLTSLYDPFGLVMPEAMSCGLPVVAFDCPSGLAQIITDGVDGFLIKNRDVDAFAEKLCLLIENPQLRMMMGKAAIQSSQRYSAERIMPQWINLFDELINPPCQ
jgi:glycosyltransferase involved in cell wall biosynthesis